MGMVVFFFKQKTAYEMLRSLVGSEMCIRDRAYVCEELSAGISKTFSATIFIVTLNCTFGVWPKTCLLYTSDAADDLLCVDLGGRRILKKKKQITII